MARRRSPLRMQAATPTLLQRRDRHEADRISIRLARMSRNTPRDKVKIAAYLEGERDRLIRYLGESRAVDMAIQYSTPSAKLRQWLRRMSRRKCRMRYLGVNHPDFVRCYSKTSIDDIRCQPNGPWRDIKVAAAILARVPAAYRHLPPDVKENEALAKAAIACDGAMIQWAPSYVQSDIDVVLLAVQTGKGPEVFPHVPRHFRSNKRVAMAAVEANGESIHSLDLSFRDDEDVILAASLEYPALPLASPRLLENDLLVRNICLRCQDTSIGPNLMPFLEADHNAEPYLYLAAKRNHSLSSQVVVGTSCSNFLFNTVFPPSELAPRLPGLALAVLRP